MMITDTQTYGAFNWLERQNSYIRVSTARQVAPGLVSKRSVVPSPSSASARVSPSRASTSRSRLAKAPMRWSAGRSSLRAMQGEDDHDPARDRHEREKAATARTGRLACRT